MLLLEAAILFIAALTSQVDSEPYSHIEWIEENESREVVESSEFGIRLHVNDIRRETDRRIGIEELETFLLDELYRGNTESLSAPLDIYVDVTFLGYTRTTTGVAVGKAMLDVEYVFPSNSEMNVEGRIMVQEFFEDTRVQAQWNYNVLRAVMDKLDHELAEVTNEAGRRIRRVVSLGCAREADAQAHVNPIDLATIDALESACGRTMGIQITSTTRLVDINDVYSTVTSRSQGAILAHQVLESQYSSDGYACVVVESILMTN